MRRSIAMLEPGAKALDRETAIRLIEEIQALEGRIRGLRTALAGVLSHETGDPAHGRTVFEGFWSGH